jgi:hypothetical protein
MKLPIILVIFKLLLILSSAKTDWYKVQTNLRMFKYQVMNIYDKPIILTNIIIYIKVVIKKHTKTVSYCLSPEDNDKLRPMKEGKRQENDGDSVQINDPFIVKTVFDVQDPGSYVEIIFRIDNCNFLLSTCFEPFRIDTGVGFFYNLQMVIDLAEEDKIFSNFPHLGKGIKETIFKARNCRLRSLLMKLEEKPNIEKLSEIITLLYLSNRRSIINMLQELTQDINRKTQQLIKTFNYRLSSYSELSIFGESEDKINISKFIEFYEGWEKSDDNQVVSDFNGLIAPMVGKLVNIVNREFQENKPLIVYSGWVKLFYRYLKNKYLNPDPSKTPKLEEDIMDFAEIVFEQQINKLVFGDAEIGCEDQQILYHALGISYKRADASAGESNTETSQDSSSETTESTGSLKNSSSSNFNDAESVEISEKVKMHKTYTELIPESSQTIKPIKLKEPSNRRNNKEEFVTLVDIRYFQYYLKNFEEKILNLNLSSFYDRISLLCDELFKDVPEDLIGKYHFISTSKLSFDKYYSQVKREVKGCDYGELSQGDQEKSKSFQSDNKRKFKY